LVPVFYSLGSIVTKLFECIGLPGVSSRISVQLEAALSFSGSRLRR
jgi:hypothetical protein